MSSEFYLGNQYRNLVFHLNWGGDLRSKYQSSKIPFLVKKKPMLFLGKIRTNIHAFIHVFLTIKVVVYQCYKF